jgi:hypothetical protein
MPKEPKDEKLNVFRLVPRKKSDETELIDTLGETIIPATPGFSVVHVFHADDGDSDDIDHDTYPVIAWRVFGNERLAPEPVCPRFACSEAGLATWGLVYPDGHVENDFRGDRFKDISDFKKWYQKAK